MAQVRQADATWQGDLNDGSGEVSAKTSGVFSNLPTTWKARTEDAEGKTSPEELFAAAHASCFSMACSNNLAKAGTPPERLQVSAVVTADKREQGWTVLSSALTVRGRVPGADARAFREAAEAAKAGCPISRAISQDVEITVEAILED